MITMQRALALEGQWFVDELRAVLAAIDDATAWRDEMETALRERVEALANRMRAAVETEGDTRAAAMREALSELLAAIERATPTTPTEADARAAWERFSEQVAPGIDGLSAALQRMSAEHRPPRPANHPRMVMHVSFGVTTAALVYLLPSRAWLVGIPLAVAIWGWSVEFLRVRSAKMNSAVMKVFGSVAHAHEWHKVNSSTWFVTGLLFIATFFPRPACALAVLSLGVGDPMAGLVGRRWGRTRLRNGRSVEGTVAFAVSATVASLVMLSVVHPGWSLGTRAMLSLAAGVTGAVTELASERLDDNFSIPAAVGAVVTAAMLALGMPTD